MIMRGDFMIPQEGPGTTHHISRLSMGSDEAPPGQLQLQQQQQQQQQQHQEEQEEEQEPEQDDQGGEPRPCRILILGDGNFSFSLALARGLLHPYPVPTTANTTTTTLTKTAPKKTPTPTNSATAASLSTAASGTVRRKQHWNRPYEIVATSFDGPLDLLRKYPESCKILAGLRSLGATALHNVDATSLDSRVVGSAVAGGDRPAGAVAEAALAVEVEGGREGSHGGAGSGGDSPDNTVAGEGRTASSSNRLQPKQYEHVIFNHPHTGTEDMRRHRSFLGHFFHAITRASAPPRGPMIDAPAGDGSSGCSSSSRGGGSSGGGATGGLSTVSAVSPGGAVHVTLAGDQAERWGLREQAARHGFSLAHRQRFPAERIEGYMTKRHQTGRSFQSRSLDSETLSFTWTGAGAGGGSGGGSGAGDGGGGVSAMLRESLRGDIPFSDEEDGIVRCRRDGGGLCGEDAALRGHRAEGLRFEIAKVGGGEGREGGAAATTVAATADGDSPRTFPPWLWPEVDLRSDGARRTNEALAEDAGEGSGETDVNGTVDTPTPAGNPQRSPLIDDDGGGGGSGGGSSRKEEGTVGTAEVVAIKRAKGKVALPKLCELCGKRYKTAQALRTHTRQLHELGQEGGKPLAPRKEEPCPHQDCDRVFTSDRALEQHVFAKHRDGGNADIKPDWFEETIYLREPPPAPASGGGGGGGRGGDGGDSSGGGGDNVDAVRERLEGVSIGSREACGVLRGVGRTMDRAGAEGGLEYLRADGTPGLVSLTRPGRDSGGEDSGAGDGGGSGGGDGHVVGGDGDTGSSDLWHCVICGFWFSSAENARLHLDNLRPPIEGAVTLHECATCMKDFGSKRALLQHTNFCGQQ